MLIALLLAIHINHYTPFHQNDALKPRELIYNRYGFWEYAQF